MTVDHYLLGMVTRTSLVTVCDRPDADIGGEILKQVIGDGFVQKEADSMLEILDETECLRLIAPGGIGRLAFAGRYDLTVLPVNYKMQGGAILFRTAHDNSTEEDLRTGIEHAEFRVAFEVDDFDPKAREGWSVLVQGPAHHLDSEAERTAAQSAGVEPWAGGDREQFISITPARITGRRIRRGSGGATAAGNTAGGN